MKEISSTQNPLIKKIFALSEKARMRKKEGLCVIEGAREVRLAIQGGYDIETLLFQPEIFKEEALQQLLALYRKPIEVIRLSKEVYEKLSYRSSTEGLIAVAKTPPHTLEALALRERSILLVAEAPEKPGNIGAMLRTADAANIEGVIIANPKTDLYNPNIIRASVGCVFTVPIAVGSTTEVIDYLKKKDFNIYCAALSASKPYYEVPFAEKNTAIVVGTEDEGLTQEWLKNSTQNIIIPMEGVIDSMNVSVAAAVLIFEAKKMRLTAKK